MSQLSIEVVRQIAKQANVPIVWELMEYRYGEPDPDALCNLIDKALDLCAAELSRYPKEYQTQSEDQLTIGLVIQLKRMGFNADHDATSGGHCDIVITDTGSFMWLGEAKKVTGVNNSHIMSGYRQLLDRYSTGGASQDRGALIIFCAAPRADNILDAWLTHLTTEVLEVTASAIDMSTLQFTSVQTHERTGRPYNVRHKPVSVYFAPLAKKIKQQADELK
jgi:hypothetical protein